MTEELLWKIFIEKARICSCKYSNMRTPREDVEQELLLHFWQHVYSKVMEHPGEYTVEQVEAYVYRAGCNACKLMLIREHEDGLWLEEAYGDWIERPGIPFEVETIVTKTGRTIVVDDVVKARREAMKEKNRRATEKRRSEAGPKPAPLSPEERKRRDQEWNRQYYAKLKEDPEKWALAQEKARQYYQAHKEKIMARTREYYREHRDEITAKDRARRAKKKAEQNEANEA